ncbi:hypothetical protein MRX96_007034 [Rhipicephalus microplus]
MIFTDLANSHTTLFNGGVARTDHLVANVDQLNAQCENEPGPSRRSQTSWLAAFEKYLRAHRVCQESRSVLYSTGAGRFTLPCGRRARNEAALEAREISRCPAESFDNAPEEPPLGFINICVARRNGRCREHAGLPGGKMAPQLSAKMYAGKSV